MRDLSPTLTVVGLPSESDLSIFMKAPVNHMEDMSPDSFASKAYSDCFGGTVDGLPLYDPEPHTTPPFFTRVGVEIGDVGWITPQGSFDVLFNVCKENKHTNPPRLPDGFETIGPIELSTLPYFDPGTTRFSNTVRQVAISDTVSSYHCSEAPGAVLELPEGAVLSEARNVRTFQELAARHGENWYKYMLATQADHAADEELYIVTGCIKCAAWGIAVFDRPSTSQDYLHFIVDKLAMEEGSSSTYSWSKSGQVICKTGRSGNGSDDEHDQCIFLRGYKVPKGRAYYKRG